MKEIADDNFKFDENGRVLQMIRKNWEREKLLMTSNFSFSNSVFKRLLLQAGKNQGLFGRGLKVTCYLKKKKNQLLLYPMVFE